MPTNKDFKRLVRARMRKTGESYTAARAHLLTKKQGHAAAGPDPRVRQVGRHDERCCAQGQDVWPSKKSWPLA